MNKKILIGIVVILALAGAYFYLMSSSRSGVPATVAPEATGKNIVVLTNTSYSPNSLTIAKGTTVVFKNESNTQMWTASAMHPSHTAYSGTALSDHCPDVNNASFDACRGYEPGESWSFTFNKVGTWKYHNHMNPSAWGSVTVQ